MNKNLLEAGFVIVGLISLFWISDVLANIPRTLKRIESRMAVLQPTEKESRYLRDERLSKLIDVEDRAMHPDIWSAKRVGEMVSLTGPN